MSRSAGNPPPQQPDPSTPGKTRTWWHPLLASVLRWQLADHYRVEEEVNVGKKPLQIDILLLQQQRGELPGSVRRMLTGLVEYLNAYTLLEFKSPSDTLRAGDFQTLLAYALLYRAQNRPLLPLDQLNVLVIAPRLTSPYREELRVCRVLAGREQPGIWRLQGGAVLHATWLLETDVLAGPDHPLLTAFSPPLLYNTDVVAQQLQRAGYSELLAYVTQQIQQFQLQGERFAMQHLGAEEELEKVLSGIWRTMPVEKRLAVLTPEERLRGLTPEQRLLGLTPEQREQLLTLLQRPQQQPKKPKRGKKA
jgi:hypothetical protein